MRLTGIILDSKSLPAHLQTETDTWEQPSETEAQSDSAIDSLLEGIFWLSLLLGGEREETVSTPWPSREGGNGNRLRIRSYHRSDCEPAASSTTRWFQGNAINVDLSGGQSNHEQNVVSY